MCFTNLFTLPFVFLVEGVYIIPRKSKAAAASHEIDDYNQKDKQDSHKEGRHFFFFSFWFFRQTLLRSYIA